MNDNNIIILFLTLILINTSDSGWARGLWVIAAVIFAGLVIGEGVQKWYSNYQKR